MLSCLGTVTTICLVSQMMYMYIHVYVYVLKIEHMPSSACIHIYELV